MTGCFAVVIRYRTVTEHVVLSDYILMSRRRFSRYNRPFRQERYTLVRRYSPFPGLTGLQLFPDSALRPARSGVSVQGIARSAQARVEVYQNGQLIEATQVPEGPFSLDNISMLSTQFPLDVKVTEQDGQLTTFSVPVTAFTNSGRRSPLWVCGTR